MRDIIESYKDAITIYSNGVANILLISFINILIAGVMGVVMYVLIVVSSIGIPLGLGGLLESGDSNLSAFILILGVTIIGLAFIFLILATSFVQGLTQAALVFVVKDAEKNKNRSVTEYFSMAWERKWDVLGLVVLTSLITVAGYILLFIPGFVAAIMLSLGLYALLLEEERALNAIKRSARLVSLRFWGFLGRMLLLMLALMGLSIAAAWIPLANIAVGMLMGSFSVVYFYVLYQDLVRLEKQTK